MIRLVPDAARVIDRFVMPGQIDRIAAIIDNVANLTEREVTRSLEEVLRRFAPRHRNISNLFELHYEKVSEMVNGHVPNANNLSPDKKMPIGLYFTMEYSIESAALFNPSIVVDPFKPDLPAGHTRVSLSFRATGEGHLSSIAFRGGVLTESNEIVVDSPGRLVDVPKTMTRHTYENTVFSRNYPR